VAAPLSYPYFRAFTPEGLPAAGYRLHTYAAGSATPLATYTDATLGVANTNPVVLDANGEAPVWLSASYYKFALHTDTDVPVWTIDNINGASGGSGGLVGPQGAPGETGATGPAGADGAPGSSALAQVSQSAAYTTVATDAGKHLLHPSADTTARTFTIAANASVAYPVGTTITFVNQNTAGVLTIAVNSDTMRLAGAGTTGNRTLAANGVCTALKIGTTDWLVSGTGLT
jgi:hypothetical protein